MKEATTAAQAAQEVRAKAGAVADAISDQEEFELGALPAVKRIASISKSEIFRRIKAGTFPAPVRLGARRCTRWNLPEVRRWVAARLAERNQAAA